MQMMPIAEWLIIGACVFRALAHDTYGTTRLAPPLNTLFRETPPPKNGLRVRRPVYPKLWI
jgi:hypothetical protein